MVHSRLSDLLFLGLKVKVIDLLCELLPPIVDVKGPSSEVELFEAERVEFDLYSLLHFLFKDKRYKEGPLSVLILVV